MEQNTRVPLPSRALPRFPSLLSFTVSPLWAGLRQRALCAPSVTQSPLGEAPQLSTHSSCPVTLDKFVSCSVPL